MATNLLELQRKKLFKTLILISSSEAYGTANFIPMKEDHPLHPTTPYAASKAAADLIALSYYQTFGNDLTIVRPFNQYGPRQNLALRGVITSSIEALLADKQPVIYGTGDQTRDYMFVKDTARGIIDAYKNARVADVRNHCAGISLARKLMKWYPKEPLDEGLKKTYEWYKRKI